jgi:atlastin
MNLNDSPLSGFSWKAGSVPHTVGILIWSEIFLAALPSGEEVAIILMDTQGSFDNLTTITNCATIFALSVLLSSVQIYNLKENIKQYDLSHLEVNASKC